MTYKAPFNVSSPKLAKMSMGVCVCTVRGEEILDQYQYLGNCPPTPPLTQQ